MGKLAACIVVVTLMVTGGMATAQDRYYVQTGAYPTIGDISASGFFQTSGTGADTVTGFDLTLSGDGQSATLCTSALFGCGTPNDAVAIQVGIVATATQLLCSPTMWRGTGAPLCLLGDTGAGRFPNASYFSMTSNAPYVFLTEYLIGGPGGSTADVISPPGGFVIAGAKQAPELDPAFAASGLALLMGGLVVLRGRKQHRRLVS